MRLVRLPVFLLISALLLPAVSRAQLPDDFDMEGPLPVDPEVIVGELDNGLRYYVRENGRPEGRASLRLVINAGSLQEEENQRGIAHFLEHMAFNGTVNFEKQELVNYLESIGMNFGQHLNASTSFDQTIYQLEVPWESEEVVEKAFLILRDWAEGLTLDPFEIEQERGVIVEEWRTGQGVGQRVRDQQYPLIYYNSHYAKRLPIGSMVVVKNAPVERFQEFYDAWYRPNLMAVIAVGDFEAKEVEQRIIERFSPLTNPEGAPERLTYEVPDHEETFFSIVTDPELTGTAVSVYLKADPEPDASATDYRRHLIERLYFTLLNQRLGERTLEADPPYLAASVGKTSLGREKQAYSMSASLFESKITEGLAALAAEVSRASRHGFSASELERVKADTVRWYDRLYEERENTASGVFASEYTRAFLVDEPIPGIALERQMARAFMEDVTIEEVNAVGEVFSRNDNRVILFTAPEKEGLAIPTKDELLAAIESGREADLGEYLDLVSDQPLMEQPPEPGAIEEEIYHESIDAYEWKLSNGARVVVKATEFKNDQILMSAFSEGGHSLVSDDDYIPSLTATMLVGESGIGPFSTIELEKKLAGQAVSLTPSINANSETISGSVSPKDLETFFKLLHLQITAPNEERLPVAFDSVKTRIAAVVANREKSPQAVFQDAIEETLYGSHPRHLPLDEARLEEMDAAQSLKIFKDRFQNAGDFTFVFVGAIELDAFRDYMETYVASLPTKEGEPETARFLGDEPAAGQHVVEVEKGLEEKTIVRALFNGEAEWSPENRYALAFARSLLSIRMREVLREEHSGVYGVGVFGSLGRIPRGTYSTGFGFSCDPGNADSLVDLALREISALQNEGAREVNVQKVKEQHVREYERGLRENGFWLSNITGVMQEGRDFADILGFPERVRTFDPVEAQRAAQRYFDSGNRVIAILKPDYSNQ